MSPMRHAARILLLMVLPVLVVSSGGCLFTPRDPDDPTTSTIKYNPRNSSRLSWENLQISLNNSDGFGWEENIHPEFTYVPDPETEIQFPGFFTGWNYEREQGFITNFYATNVTIESVMRDPDFNPPPDTGSEVRWEGVIYFLRVTDPNDGSENRYRASAIITFRLEGNFWYIYSWEDQQGESDPDNPAQTLPTMGVLRGTFGSN